jgi:hypothetical protein
MAAKWLSLGVISVQPIQSLSGWMATKQLMVLEYSNALNAALSARRI